MLDNNAVKYGMYTGLALIGASLACYVIGVFLFGVDMYGVGYGIMNSFVRLGITLFGMVYGLRFIRDKVMDGYIGFKQALAHVFVIGVTALLMLSVYSYVFMTVIEPDYLSEGIERTMQMIENNPAFTEEMLDRMYDDMASQTPVASVAGTLLYSLIFHFIMSLIVAGIMKKEHPVFVTGEHDEDATAPDTK